MSDGYPVDCPYCGETLETMTMHDLHMERNHTDKEADIAVAQAILRELREYD